MICVVIRSYIRSTYKTCVNTSIMININIFKIKFVGNKHIFKCYCCLAVLHIYIVVFPCQNQPKMMYIYGLATCFQPLTIFHYSKKGKVPHGKLSLISMQKLYMKYGY